MSGTGGAPLVSVVVVNLDGRRHLDRCLPSVFATTGVAFEVIVADNGSADDSVAWCAREWPAARVLPLGRNLGFGAANRRGVDAAAGSFVAFLNNDTVVEPGWLSALLEPLLADAEIGASCATLRLLDRPRLLNARGGGMTTTGHSFDVDFLVPADRPPVGGSGRWRDVLFPTAAAALVRKRDFLEVGGFDPAMFMYHEDVDLGLRLWLLGRRVVVCDGAVVHHAFGGTSRESRGLAWRERLGMRHNVRTLLKCYRPASLARTLARIAKIWVRTGGYGQALSTCAWNLRHLPSTLAERRRLQARRVRSEADLHHRGLILGTGWPPAAPDPPADDTPERRADAVPSPTLLPGHHSGRGRLGPGWFAPETVDGERARWTCGFATCWLREDPGRRGVLEAEVAVGRPDPGGPVTLRCNGRETAAPGGPGWATLALPVEADARGFLEASLASPTWRPHDARGDWDFRTLGCAVRALRFRPADPVVASSEPSVSVIIPTYNRWPELRTTLEALACQSYRRFEVVVVDDGSTDETPESLAAWREAHAGAVSLHVIRQANAKQGRARNRGLREATGELVVFLGDDVVPEPRFLEEHVAAHRELGEPAAVIGFTDWDRARVRVTPFLEFVNREGAQFAFGLIEDGKDAPYTCFYTSNVSIPRELLGDDPFHHAFTSYGWEDVELGYRLTTRGVRIVYRRAAAARHSHPTNLTAFLRRQRQVGAATAALFALHPELERDEFMAPPAATVAARFARVARPFATPVLAVLDRLGVTLPRRVYRGAVFAAYRAGRAEAR